MRNIQTIYIILAILIWFIGYFHHGKFVKPRWKIPGKFFFYVGVSFALSYWFLHWSLLFIVLHPLIGFIFHVRVCKKHHINWKTCEPKQKYIELQEKWAKGDF